ncbi:hypothetical protein Peur_021841 [Populus x canadensis]|uniref:CRIB domain-containing protein RIC4-like n=1 Tax=Populus nigra TaxID=3691 RepID=UPI002B279E65|nr:CRIB domain-containing protein RIC4-like [Populus nigra]
MRDHMERFVVLPFSIACASHSSVDVASSESCKKPKPETKSHATRGQEGEESSCKEKTKNNTLGFLLALPKPCISSSFHKLIRSIKTLSQVFVYKEEDEELMEREMEIGYPTDVKHVTHIGLDGTTMTNPIKGWECLKSPEIIPFPSFTLRQFELAMAAQAHGPLVGVDHSKLV